MSSWFHTAENVLYGATDIFEIGEMMGGHAFSPVGTAVHGASALGHLGYGLYQDHFGGDDKGAKHHYAEAALNAVEAIPLVGTGVSIANLISQYAGNEDGRHDALPDLVEKWMFGDRSFTHDLGQALPWFRDAPADEGPISVPIDPDKVYDENRALDRVADRSWQAFQEQEARDERDYFEEFDHDVEMDLRRQASVPRPEPGRDHTFPEQVRNFKKWVEEETRTGR